MTTFRRLLLEVPAFAVAVSIATVGQGLEARATESTAVLSQVETDSGFTAPLGSGKGSVTSPSATRSLALNLLGEEPVYYP